METRRHAHPAGLNAGHPRSLFPAQWGAGLRDTRDVWSQGVVLECTRVYLLSFGSWQSNEAWWASWPLGGKKKIGQNALKAQEGPPLGSSKAGDTHRQPAGASLTQRTLLSFCSVQALETKGEENQTDSRPGSPQPQSQSD